MMRLLFFLLLFPSLCFADAGVIGLEANNEAGGECTQSTLLSSGFEGETDDRDQWTVTGTGALDHSSASLDMYGTSVARLDAGANIKVAGGTFDKSEAWVVFAYRVDGEGVIDENDGVGLAFRNSSNGYLANITHRNGGNIRLLSTGGTSSTYDIDFVQDQTYWFKLHYKTTGSAAEAHLSVWDDVDTWDANWNVTNGTSTTNIDHIIAANSRDTSTEYVYMDEIYVLNCDYTGDPESL